MKVSMAARSTPTRSAIISSGIPASRSLSAVHLNARAFRGRHLLRDDLGSRQYLTDILVLLWAHVDAASNALDAAAFGQVTEHLVDGSPGAHGQELGREKWFSLGDRPNPFFDEIFCAHGIDRISSWSFINRRNQKL